MTREKLKEEMKAAMLAKKDEMIAVYGRDAGMFDMFALYSEAAFFALEAAGVRMVPVEATEEMIWAAADTWREGRTIEAAKTEEYRAMLAASPYTQKDTKE